MLKYQPIHSLKYLGIFITIALFASPILAGQFQMNNVSEDQSALSENTSNEKSPEKTNRLDKLLELADKDPSKLSDVRIQSKSTSPSLDTPVSTVSRQESTVGKSPAAVFVITNEMIRRSGAKTVPDVLRLAPGVEVARIDANKWAISIRGLNGRFANNLLVQIDGRSVYTPLFGGVFWDVQDVLLEDVERIEVIRGPGASMWGANAVNGIINIITKSAKDTQGTYLESGVGTEELGFTNVRYGGGSGDLQYRFYGKWFERDAGYVPNGEAFDDWRQARGGFRMDWKASEEDVVTFQGDYYNGYSGDQAKFSQFSFPYSYINHDDTHVSGANALVRWQRVFDEQSDWTVWLYFDRTERHWINYGLAEDRDTFDIDCQRRFPLGDRHNVICGFGYRTTKDAIQNSPTRMLIPDHRSDYILSYFAQDEITLEEKTWRLTVGSKFEHNDYTNFEYQPTVRLLYTPDDRHSIWGAVSRAVRTPTRGEVDNLAIIAPQYPIPVFPMIVGNPGLISEELIAYECGYRVQATDRFSWDLAVFLNEYQHLTMPIYGGLIPGPGGIFYLPLTLTNAGAGQGYGFEWAADYVVNPQWKLRGAYSLLIMEIGPVFHSNAPTSLEGDSPRNQYNLQSSWDLGKNWELDMIGRYVDSLASLNVPSYFVGDIRLAWRPRPGLEWSVVGRNLFPGAHLEYGDDDYLGTLHTEVQQEVYTQLIWRR
jgi:iron complex outermembrane recepter protein